MTCSSAPFSVSVCRPLGREDCRVLGSDPSPSLLCLRHGFVGTWLHMLKSSPNTPTAISAKDPFRTLILLLTTRYGLNCVPYNSYTEVLSSCTSEHDLPWRKGLDGSEDSRSHMCAYEEWTCGDTHAHRENTAGHEGREPSCPHLTRPPEL